MSPGKLCILAAITWPLGTLAGFAQQMNPEQIEMIKNTATSICDTVKEAKGHKTEVQIEGDIKAQLGGLIGKVANAGASGKGSLLREDFEGLSRDATATALQGDRDCRERLFNKMFDKLTASSSTPSGSVKVVCAQQGVAIGGNVSGSTVTNTTSGSTNSAPCAETGQVKK